MSASASASYFVAFQSAKRNIEAALTDGKPPTPEVLAQLSALKADLAQNIASLPPYDQRSCTQQLNELTTRVNASQPADKPKSKFSFARSASNAPATSTTPAPTVPPPTGPAHEQSSVASGTTLAQTDISTDAENAQTHVIADRTSSLIRLPVEAKGTTISLSNITDSIIDLRPTSSGKSTATTPRSDRVPTTPTIARSSGLAFSPTHARNGGSAGDGNVTSLHARSLKRCVLIVDVEGSAILHGLDDCVVVLSCHQFRIHSSHRTAILLHSHSIPIIEHSDSLYFGSLPAHMGRDANTSMHERVQDFDWVKGGPSPNWRALGTTASEMVYSREEADAIRHMDEDEVDEAVERITSSLAGLGTAQ